MDHLTEALRRYEWITEERAAEICRAVELHQTVLRREKKKPRFAHNCGSCVFLGRKDFADGDDTRKFDLYWCPQTGTETIVVRFGNDEPEYASGLLTGPDTLNVSRAQRWGRSIAAGLGLPVWRSREEVHQLQERWLSNPWWDIETTTGFEAQRAELLEFRLAMEAQWAKNRARAEG